LPFIVLTGHLWEILCQSSRRVTPAPAPDGRTVVSNQIVESRIERRTRIYKEIAAFASEHAGSELDLDEDLERAALESLGDVPLSTLKVDFSPGEDGDAPREG
jgi:hypothetical protein